MNLLKETKEGIKRSGHEINDIIFIGSEQSGHTCTWEEFTVLADREYNAGFGAQEVANDLIIVFSDGAKMWRIEYEGFERWAYSTPFEKPEASLPITNLFGGMWLSLQQINECRADG